MRPLDIAVIIVYLVGVVWAGLASRGKKGDSDEFFTSKGGFTGRLGMVMVGFSMAATLFSGISYVVYTSVAFSAGAGIVIGMLGFPRTWVLLRFWFLPRYLAGGGSHPYDIIEERLGTSVRLCLSAMFILLRIGWMAAPAWTLQAIMTAPWPSPSTCCRTSTPRRAAAATASGVRS